MQQKLPKGLINSSLLCLCLLLGSALVYGEESKKAKAQTESEKIQSLTAEWKETLRFGIDDEVIEVVKAIRAAKETSLNNDLKTLFMDTISVKVKIAVLDYFTLEKAKNLEEPVITILKHREDDTKKVDRELILACLRYLLGIESYSELDLYKELVASEDKGFAATAIKLLGKTHNPAAGPFLLEKLNDIEYEEELKPEIVLALGELRYQEAVEPLVKIIEDKSQDKGMRMYACEALGDIGDAKAIEPLKAIFIEDDALIKSYAAAALSKFKVPEVAGLLIQGLKDANWKVRVTAARGLAEVKASEALDILMYKAEKDPVNDVREESIKALGELGKGEGYNLLKTMYAEDKQPLNIRDICLTVLLDKDPGNAIAVSQEIVKKEIARPHPNDDLLGMITVKLSAVQRGDSKEIFVKLLESKNINIKIYAIRGIGANRYGDLRATIEKISKEDPVVAIKRAALAVLEKW